MSVAEALEAPAPLNLFRYQPTPPPEPVEPADVLDALKVLGSAAATFWAAIKLTVRFAIHDALKWLEAKILHSLWAAWLIGAAGWSSAATFLVIFAVR